MSTLAASRPDPSSPADSLLGVSSPVAGALCLFGVFLHILLSDALLTAIGIHHSDDRGQVYERIHPGTVFIVLSFFVLLASGSGGSIRRLGAIAAQQTASVVLLFLVILVTCYTTARGGPSGMTFMLDTHMTPPLCAIVLCYTPLSYCRRALYGFLLLAAINSAVGIAEGIGKFRIFTFDPDWGVLHELQFRASAFLGHPLNNAMFTSFAVFIALALRIPVALKAALAALLLASLVAFGGRGGLAFGVAGCLAYLLISVATAFYRRRLTLPQVFLLLASLIVVPAALLGGIYLLLHTGMGDRIVAHAALDDESAQGRKIAFKALHYMTDEELIFGVPLARISDITYRIGLELPFKDIENPWILMLMFLGGLMFPFWFAATLAFIWRLMRRQPLALKLAVIAYFAVASTSNSFGRKDSNYLIMVSAVICASRVLAPPLPGRSKDDTVGAPPPDMASLAPS